MPAKLPLQGSNLDSPDPESGVPRAAIPARARKSAPEARPNGTGQSHDFSHDGRYGGRLTKAQRQQHEWGRIRAVFGGHCAYCGGEPTLLVREHMMPRARGGDDSTENIVPACIPCNTRKGRRTPLEWFLALDERKIEPEYTLLVRHPMAYYADRPCTACGHGWLRPVIDTDDPRLPIYDMCIRCGRFQLPTPSAAGGR